MQTIEFAVDKEPSQPGYRVIMLVGANKGIRPVGLKTHDSEERALDAFLRALSRIIDEQVK